MPHVNIAIGGHIVPVHPLLAASLMTSSPAQPKPQLVEQPPRETPANPSLYLLGMQAQEISGEIALAAEMLESDDEEERIAAIALLEQALTAEEGTKAAMAAKAESYFAYRSILLAQAEWRKAEAKRLAALAKADEARAEKMLDTAAKVFGTLYPDQNKFSFPSYELVKRKSPGKVELEDETLLPEDLPERYVRIKLEIEVTSRELIEKIEDLDAGVTLLKHTEELDKKAIKETLKAKAQLQGLLATKTAPADQAAIKAALDEAACLKGLRLDTTPSWSVK
jgi:Siphovirus Gp157